MEICLQGRCGLSRFVESQKSLYSCIDWGMSTHIRDAYTFATVVLLLVKTTFCLESISECFVSSFFFFQNFWLCVLLYANCSAGADLLSLSFLLGLGILIHVLFDWLIEWFVRVWCWLVWVCMNIPGMMEVPWSRGAVRGSLWQLMGLTADRWLCERGNKRAREAYKCLLTSTVYLNLHPQSIS